MSASDARPTTPSHRGISPLILSTTLLGWNDRALTRPPNVITRKVVLLITDKDLREEIRRFGLGYLHSKKTDLPLAGKRRPRGCELFLLRRVEFRVCEAEVLQRVHDRPGDHEPGEPLVVGRHYEPRRVL